MLVLSRKPGEAIRIGEDIVVTITEVRGGRVKIGIQAPASCSIRRGELPDWNQTPAAPAPKTAERERPLRKARLALSMPAAPSQFATH